jgi:MscS family membrane protein
VIPFIDPSITSLIGFISDILLIILVTYLLASVSELFITRYVRKQIKKANPEAAESITKNIRDSVILLFLFLGLRFAYPLFSLDPMANRLLDVTTYIASVSLLSYALILSTDSILSNMLENLIKKTKTPIQRSTVKKIRRSALLIILLVVIRIALLALNLAPSVYGMVDAITYLATVVIVAYIIASISEVSIVYFLVVFGGKDSREIKRIIPPLVFKAITLIIYLIALFNILTYFNVEVGPLMAGMGVAGIAVALASQTIFADMFSGMILSVDKPFKIGDRILLEDGSYGEVTDIGNRTTKLKTIYSTVLTLPNSVISSQVITNLSAPDYRLRVEVPIAVSYSSDMVKVKKVLKEVAMDCNTVLKKPEPTVLFIGFEDYYLDLRLLVWSTADIPPQEVKDEVCTKILEAFRKNKITIPFPIRTLDMPEKKKKRF